ncbi:protein MODIFIER OF SNC1 1-like isoform X2 [Typha angustifolia]|uniref:protein MODIFIER OF SNC1 1-like isoform X2 n=1 Tax=Typha angustifolia TaxID=59011 RepID=UPI003C2DFD51
MASSALTADRRWASSRKSGMTVLGKVPKPINLPSQRLENNGLDPTVEIVPKGTLTWGTRASSAASNAWNSSTVLSPKADGGVGSPSHNGRPSSGGSGTRPSTAGSDKSQDSCSWGPTSRPSTASGLLMSNHISVIATRPRSAETRPGSSQLSRFAENSGENITPWGKGMPEKLGSTPSSGFTLTSGDFPTLGSEKNSELHAQRGHSLQGRPTSGSGRDLTSKEGPVDGDCNLHASRKHGDMDTLNTDKSSHVGDGSQPNANWHRELKQSQPYNLNMAPHHFDSWRAPLARPPDGNWPRVGAPGGPYRPGVANPGGFPVDPFVYYPQFQLNSEAALRPGAGQGGYHPKPGEAYNPHLPPNSYMGAGHPVLPATPGVYHTPIPFDGYYGPPRANFCGTGEREVPFMGVTNQPIVLNQHTNHNDKHDPGQFQRRSGKHDRLVPYEKIESDRTHGQYKVLLKQHDGWESSHAQERKDQAVTTHLSHPDGSVPAETTREAEKHMDSKKDKVPLKPEPDLKDLPGAASNWRGSSNNVTIELQQSPCEANDGVLSTKPKSTSVIHDQQPVIRKNASLIEKIEGLNNKARSSHIQSEVEQLSSKEDKAKFKVVNAKTDHPAKVVCSNVSQAETAAKAAPISCEVNLSAIESSQKVPTDSKVVLGTSEPEVTEVGKSNSLKPEVTHSHVHKKANTRRSTFDQPAKSRSNILAGDDLTKKHPERDSLAIASPGLSDLYNQSCDESNLKDSHSSTGGDTHPSSLDSAEYKTQRSKLKEIAAQRAEQLQKEEEERTREQKAKALAKLEELNRRSAQTVKKMNDALPASDTQNKQGSQASTDVKADMLTNESIDGDLAENFDASAHANDTEARDVAAAELPSISIGSEVTSQEYMIPHHPSAAHEQQSDTAASITHRSIAHSLNSNVSRHKQMSYRRRQNIPQGKLPGEKPNVTGNMDNTQNFVEVDAQTSTNDGVCRYEDSSVQHKKRTGRNSRNKNKVDDSPVSSSLPSLATEEKSEKGASDDMKIHPSALTAETSMVSAGSSSKTTGSHSLTDVVLRTTDQGWSKVTQEAHGKMSNQWKSQPPRRSARNQQVLRPVDKFQGSEATIWAPAKQSNRNEQSEEGNQNIVDATGSQSSGKNENDLPNVMKSKRAEMERYIPKPVAKELLQQENTLQPSSRNQAPSFHTSGKPNVDIKIPDKGKVDGSTVGIPEYTSDTKIMEANKPTRRGRMHASWRQRCSAESSASFSEHPISCGNAEHVQKLSDQHQPKLDNPPEKHLKSDAWDITDADSVLTEPVTTHAAIRDQGTSGRQRQEQIKIHRFARNNYAQHDKNIESGTGDCSYIQSSVSDSNQAELRNASKVPNKNSGSEHTRSHWKPKPHSYAQSHQKGSGSNNGQGVVSQGDVFDKDLPSQGYGSTVLDKNSVEVQNYCIGDIMNERCHEGDIVEKSVMDSTNEHIHVVNKDVSDKVTSEVEAQTEQISQAAHWRGQLKNGRFPRGQEVIYRGKDSRQDVKQNLSTNGEKRKNNIRLEYQPVGSHSKPIDLFQQKSNVEEVQEGNAASGPSGPRDREQGHNHSRRSGHFVKRSSGPVGDSHVGEWKSGHANLEQ